MVLPSSLTPAKPEKVPDTFSSVDWTHRVNQPLSDQELEALRRCVRRGQPFGGERWTERIAKKLGLESTLRARGRPRLPVDESD